MNSLFLPFVLATLMGTTHASETASYDELKAALTEHVKPSEGSMYEYELNYKFTTKNFLGITKKTGVATVIGRTSGLEDLGSAPYFSLEADGLDQAQKTFFIKGQKKNVFDSIEILFSLNEWEKQGRDRGSEATQLLIHKSKETGAPIVYFKNRINEWTETEAKVVMKDDSIEIHSLSEDANGKKEKRILKIARNATLDLKMYLDLGSEPVLLASYKGGKR